MHQAQIIDSEEEGVKGTVATTVTLRLFRIPLSPDKREGAHYKKLLRLLSKTAGVSFTSKEADGNEWFITPANEDGWAFLNRYGLTESILRYLWEEAEVEIQNLKQDGTWADVYELPSITERAGPETD